MNRSGTAAFRGALWITLIALLTTGLALTAQYLQTTRLLDARMQAMLSDEMISLLDRYRSGGLTSVAGFVERQQRLPRFNGYFYVLADADGAVLVGDLTAWPAGLETTGRGSFDVQLVSPSNRLQRRSAETLVVALQQRYRLLIGRIAEDRAEIRRQYVRAMIWSMLLTGLVGLSLGWWFSRRSLSFVAEVAEAGQRFLGGRLEERIPVTARGDEYDRLAGTMNACFDEIEHVVRSLRAATDGMAHDLKTPLTRLRARLELAEMRGAEGEELREVVEASRRDLEAILRIIADVLDVAKAEAASAESFAKLDLQQLVQEVLELYEPVADARSISVQTSLEEAPIRGSRSLLGQLVANLIDNAIKFSPDGSTISVRVRRAGDEVELSVGDRGPGIPPEKRSDVLSRFVRLDESRAKDGVGLGLSIVSAVARVHRARLELTSNDPGLCILVKFATELEPVGTS